MIAIRDHGRFAWHYAPYGPLACINGKVDCFIDNIVRGRFRHVWDRVDMTVWETARLHVVRHPGLNLWP